MNRFETSLADGRRLTLYWGGKDNALPRRVGPVGSQGPAAPVAVHGERRLDPTTGDWVTLASHRQERTYKPPAESCPLCPTRPGGQLTEIPFEAFEVAVFDNRFPSYTPEAATARPAGGEGLYQVAPASGRCEVMVYSDDHGATFSDLGLERVRLLVDVWADRTATLAAEAPVVYVMPFENKGELIGTTLSHPHGQIYAYPMVPPRPQAELGTVERYRERTGRCVWCDTVAQEMSAGGRLVTTNDTWAAFVPFWARLPYQVEVVALGHFAWLPALAEHERDGLADVLLRTARAYDALWGFSLPYILAFSQRPAKEGQRWAPVSHVRASFLPLHRDAERFKYLAGSELAAGAFLNDVAPEDAAARLRDAGARLRDASGATTFE